MAENRVGRRVNKVCGNPSPCRAGGGRDPGQSPQRRQARVTVTYNRDELQRRLEVERWIDRGLDRLYRGEEDMPEEVNIDELLDLKTDEERTHRLLIPPPGLSVESACSPRVCVGSFRYSGFLPQSTDVQSVGLG
uniref:Protein phosphatase 1, regulatory (inhibitor) subunit 14Ab n=1 Tax=Oreochromis aureus TaxID=47969 RepID=A0AAZ1X757_OREAU